MISLLFEANECFLQVMSRGPHDRTSETGLQRHLHDVWPNLDAAALRRAARIPLLLMDFSGWDAEPGTSDTIERSGFFPPQEAAFLMRMALTLAWHVCQTEPQRSGPVLGVSPQAVQRLAGLKLHDLDRLAQSSAHCLRPRWHDRPQYWIELLMAARNEHEAAFDDFSLRALQGLIGELLPHYPQG